MLPTRVGMVRGWVCLRIRIRDAPHSRGDGPTVINLDTVPDPCSPLAWGWSAAEPGPTCHGNMLPTRVGMVRNQAIAIRCPGYAPHSRGDGPTNPHGHVPDFECSPLAWGWSAIIGGDATGLEMLPTRVGMVRLMTLFFASARDAPHSRGDGPQRVGRQICLI